jgi:predicted nucleic acid-binding protein
LNTLVIDASIAIKWVVEEDGTDLALALRQQARLMAPDLIVAECANILWKKVQRKELSRDEALIAARLLQSAEIELVPTRALMESATRLEIELDHPAYDCLYLALAVENSCRFVKPSWLLYVRRLTRETPAVLPSAAYFPVSEKLLNFLPHGVREWLRFTSLAAPKLICLKSPLIPCKRGA